VINYEENNRKIKGDAVER